eukprot:7994332-Pyramimonas_sp.AAC.1
MVPVSCCAGAGTHKSFVAFFNSVAALAIRGTGVGVKIVGVRMPTIEYSEGRVGAVYDCLNAVAHLGD